LFRGVSTLALDAKGRMTLPVRYRDPLQEQCAGQLVVTIDTEEQCLLIYPLPEWENIEAKLDALPSFNRAARRVQRLLIGHATEAEVDGSGRVLLPGPLRDYARLQKKAVLIGQGKKFELWDEQTWTQRRDQWLEGEGGEGIELPEALGSLSL
jgi:MraZ protein